MITIQEVSKARSNPSKCVDIINTILYDGSKPKFRMYLVKMGIPFGDTVEYEMMGRELILQYLIGDKKDRYTHDRVPFDKFAWISIVNMVLNELKSKNIRDDRYNSIDEYIYEDGIEEPREWMGTDKIDEFVFDAENLFMNLSQRQAFICRCIYYNGWNRFEVINYLGIDKEEYDKELGEIKEVFSEIM